MQLEEIMSKVVLKCSNLTKKLNKNTKIENVSFEVCEKDILGFIGPNGAGKTTIIKLILGLYNFDSGSVEIGSFDLKKDFVKAISQVGAIIENPDLYMYMTGYENLMISARIYNISKKKVDEVIKLVNLEKKINEKVSTYSLGMRQRLGIAQAIIHSPKVLILDEPTNGLDPKGIIELNEILKKLSHNGMAIIVSSHILSELESLCNKICVVNNGSIIKYMEMKELKNFSSNYNYIIELDRIDSKKILEGYDYKVIDNSHIKICISKNNLNDLIDRLIKNKIKIYEIKKDVLSLEEIFLSMTRGDTND